MNQGPTIDDVAREAGVSVATVSRVLRDQSDVSAATRDHVREVIGALGYRPSPIARALVTGRSRVLVLLVNDLVNPFYPQLAKSVEQEAKKAGYAVVICNTDDRTVETRRYVERLLTQGIDGVIHASVARDEKTLLSMIDNERRIVFTNRRPGNPGVSYVVSDNELGAAALTRHLLSLHHRRIGFVAGPLYAPNALERLSGFRRAMAAMERAEPLVAKGDFSTESGRRAVQEWVRRPDPPTAVIAVNDAAALGALEALAQNNLKVPHDVAVAGFDGTQLSSSPLIRLTTVDQHIGKLGSRAVQIFLRQIDGSGDFEPVHEVLPTHLLIRDSTVGDRP